MPPCPGCPRFGSAALDPSAVERLEKLGSTFDIAIEQMQGERQHFRRRARLSIRGRMKSPKIGVFTAGSHQVADIPKCSVHHPTINLVTQQLKSAIQKLGVPPYSDKAHAGLLRGIQVVVQRDSNQAQVTIIGNSVDSAPAQPLLLQLKQNLGKQLHSLWWNGNIERTNRVLGPHWEHLNGPAEVEEILGGARVYFPPGAFGQNNLNLFDSMLAQVHGWVPDGCDLVELYCGSGSLGLGLLSRVRSLVFNEIGEASLAGLKKGLAAQSDACRARATIAEGTAESVVELLASNQVVIVDPPRKGMEEAVLEALCAQLPQRLIYISCGLNSFVRDSQRLAKAGLIPRHITAYDLFPFTDHVETVALFEPKS